ncbi:MAG: zf-HC2 domain-containing protein [Planctomycetes bacterium]|nr:zf-HC2 domain-containing protein [Planctomycetota bacterium]MBI3844263.1 zf-HC2 domain-containing protein [Planctomycetota bacterium]
MSDTKCEFRDDAGAYWDGELDVERRLAFERHLARCGACRRDVAAASRVDALLRAADPARVKPLRRSRVWRTVIVIAAAAAILAVAWISNRPATPGAPSGSPPIDPVVAAPEAIPALPIAVEICPAIEDWATFRKVAAESLASFDGTSDGLSRIRRLVGLSPRVLADALPDVPDDAFGGASRAVIALAGAPGVRAVAAEAARRDRRIDAARSLAAARDSEAVEAALLQLREWIAEPALQADVIDALGAVDHPSARAILATIAEDESDAPGRERARRALAASNAPVAMGLLAQIGEKGIDAPAIRALLASRSNPLVAWFRETPSTRAGYRFAVGVLASLGDRDASDHLVRLAASGTDPRAHALLVAAGDGIVPRLRESLRASERPLRAAALDALAEIPGRAALDALFAAVSQAELREPALDAIASRGDADAVSGLVSLLRRGESERLVIAALVKINDPRAIPALEGLRASPSISGQVTEALRALRGGRT